MDAGKDSNLGIRRPFIWEAGLNSFIYGSECYLGIGEEFSIPAHQYVVDFGAWFETFIYEFI